MKTLVATLLFATAVFTRQHRAVIITHDAVLAKRASRVVEIRDGRITADYAPA